LFSWCGVLPMGSYISPPLIITMMLRWIASEVRTARAFPFAQRPVQMGERFRADVKAEGRRVVLGGWELGGSNDPSLSRWSSIELSETDIPWAYVKGDPFRTVVSLELPASLLRIVVFDIKCEGDGRASIALTGSTDNKGNTFLGDRLVVTKYPLYRIHMETMKQLSNRNIILTGRE
jgi:hypothetical protein